MPTTRTQRPGPIKAQIQGHRVRAHQVRAHRVRALPEPSAQLPQLAAALRSSVADRSLESPAQVKTRPSAYLTKKTTTINGNSSTIRALIAVDFSPRPTSPLCKGQAVPYRRALPGPQARR